MHIWIPGQVFVFPIVNAGDNNDSENAIVDVDIDLKSVFQIHSVYRRSFFCWSIVQAGLWSYPLMLIFLVVKLSESCSIQALVSKLKIIVIFGGLKADKGDQGCGLINPMKRIAVEFNTIGQA